MSTVEAPFRCKLTDEQRRIVATVRELTQGSRAGGASACVVFTRVSGKPGRDGIGCVLVERGTEGLVLAGKYHTMGGEYLQGVRLEDCELPAENLLLAEGGFKQLISAFN